MKLSERQKALLVVSYFSHFPQQIEEDAVRDYNLVIRFRHLFNSCVPTESVLDGLLDIVIDRIISQKRFQRELLLKLILHNLNGINPSEEIREKLFFVFTSFILNIGEGTIGWKVTRLIKDVELSDDQIKWLIINYEHSEHIQNRLLRYPKPHIQITKWANKCLREGKLKNRLSELLALQLNFSSKVKHKNREALLWAIHYSKLDAQTKKILLKRYVSEKCFEEFIKICNKNNFSDLVSDMYEECSNET